MKPLLFCFCFLIFGTFSSQAQTISVRRLAISPCRSLFFSDLEISMIRHGLKNVRYFIPDAVIDLRYASENNFLKTNVYGDFNACYLQADVIARLVKADSVLKVLKPGWRFVFYDCTRPVSVQKKMWEVLDVPIAEKGKYVSNPKNLSVHNLGAAVDISLADEKGNYADMGTDFDYFGELAYPFMENALLKKGLLSPEQIANRKVLREVMKQAAFSNQPYEWWHFNAYSRQLAKQKYNSVD